MSRPAIIDEIRSELREAEVRLRHASSAERRRIERRVAELRTLLDDVERGVASPRVLAFATGRRLRRWLRLGLPE